MLSGASGCVLSSLILTADDSVPLNHPHIRFYLYPAIASSLRFLLTPCDPLGVQQLVAVT